MSDTFNHALDAFECQSREDNSGEGYYRANNNYFYITKEKSYVDLTGRASIVCKTDKAVLLQLSSTVQQWVPKSLMKGEFEVESWFLRQELR